VIPLYRRTSHTAAPMATTTLCPSRPPAAASSLSRSNKITTEPTTQLANGHLALDRADPPPIRPVLHLNAAAATLTKYP
jgi:hypothetical protein